MHVRAAPTRARIAADEHRRRWRCRTAAAGDEAARPAATPWPGRAPAADRPPGRCDAPIRSRSWPRRRGSGRRRCWPTGSPAPDGRAARRRGCPSMPATTTRPSSGPTSSPPCSRSCPTPGRSALSLLRSSQPLESVVASLLNDLADVADDVVLVLDDYHVIESAPAARNHGVPAGASAAAGPPGARQPGRSAPAAGASSRSGRAARDPCRRPAVHRRRGRRLLQRGDGPAPDGGAMSTPSRLEPRGGSPRCSSRRCRCRAATTPAGSSRASPATTASWSTTSRRRCWSASPMRSEASCSRPRSWTGSPGLCAMR